MSSRLDHITDWENRAEQVGFRIAALARQCGVTDRQLRRYFLHKFGSPPHVWITLKRLERIRPLLSQGELIKQVAAMAGFSQLANFSRRFKNCYNAAPSTLRLRE